MIIFGWLGCGPNSALAVCIIPVRPYKQSVTDWENILDIKLKKGEISTICFCHSRPRWEVSILLTSHQPGKCANPLTATVTAARQTSRRFSPDRPVTISNQTNRLTS